MALFSSTCDFVIGAQNIADIPASALPEVAFAGRSNVGKSSLINALTKRKNLARTSNTPGRTQQLNFFCIDERLMLVDLPGYGYAKASKKAVAGWNQLIIDYLRGRQQLTRLFLLIDSRHGLKANDLETMQMLDAYAVPYQVVLTKADKCKATELETRLADTTTTLQKHGAAHPVVLLTSAEKKEGLGALRDAIASCL